MPTSGGGGGGGGAVTIASGAVASGAYSAGSLAAGAGVDGWNLTEGAKADSAYAGSGSASIVAILKGLYTGITNPIPAGTNIIGKVDIDQTTPGTTNAVAKAPMTPAVADAATSKVVLASATATVGFVWAHAENYSATGGFLIVYNATSAPSTGALTASLILACQRLPGSGNADIQRNPGLSASVGVVLLVTSASTCATYTTGTVTANLTGAAS